MFLTTFSIRNAFGAASCFLAALACGSSESTGPSTGSVEVVATTTGADLDPDGYAVAVDGGGGLSLPVNGTVTFTQLRDRKSTRLNSSHDQISYAVFCLKKKKNKKETQ